jgi:hypothetical protein
MMLLQTIAASMAVMSAIRSILQMAVDQKRVGDRFSSFKTIKSQPSGFLSGCLMEEEHVKSQSNQLKVKKEQKNGRVTRISDAQGWQ